MILKDEREFAAQNAIDCLTLYCEEAVPDSERKTRRCIAALSKGDDLQAQNLGDAKIFQKKPHKHHRRRQKNC